VAIGIDFKNSKPHGLPPLPGAVKEAMAVVTIFGGRSLTDESATKARLVEALLRAPRAHCDSRPAGSFPPIATGAPFNIPASGDRPKLRRPQPR